jgi:hypothetical protein
MVERDAHALTEDIMKYEMRSFFIDRSTRESNAFLHKEWSKCIELLEEGIPVKPKQDLLYDENNIPQPICQVARSRIGSFKRLRANVQKKRELLVDVLKFMCPRFKELQDGETTTTMGALVDKSQGYKDIKDHRIWPNDVFFVINNGTEAILNHVLRDFLETNLYSWEHIQDEDQVKEIKECFYPDQNKRDIEEKKPDTDRQRFYDIVDHIWTTFHDEVEEKNICILNPWTDRMDDMYCMPVDIKRYRKNPEITEEDIENVKDVTRWEWIEEYADDLLRDMLNIYVNTTLEDGYFHPEKTGIDASKETFLECHPKYLFNKGVMIEDDLDHAFYQIGCFLEDLDMKVEHGDEEE